MIDSRVDQTKTYTPTYAKEMNDHIMPQLL